eukprot:maker-scaffold_49-snap-gene-0.7-mRNA-1 protein AED:0.31 eAED:0.31 QI:90/0.85/0.75/1/0.57/0.37/8/0/308
MKAQRILAALFFATPLFSLTHGKGCSSLDGPFCESVNGLAVPAFLKAVSRKSASSGNLFSDDLVKAIENAMSQVNNDLARVKPAQPKKKKILKSIKGALKMTGKLSSDLALFLAAGDWIQEPEGFVGVNLDGTVDDETMQLVFTILDLESTPISDCSKLIANFLPASNQHWNPENGVFISGTWLGDYVCHGTATKAHLELQTVGNLQDGAFLIEGVFRFETNPKPVVQENSVPDEVLITDEELKEMLAGEAKENIENFKRIVNQFLADGDIDIQFEVVNVPETKENEEKLEDEPEDTMITDAATRLKN